jgi:hypothetical protein
MAETAHLHASLVFFAAAPYQSRSTAPSVKNKRKPSEQRQWRLVQAATQESHKREYIAAPVAWIFNCPVAWVAGCSLTGVLPGIPLESWVL